MPSENIFLTRDISGKLKEFLQGKQYSSVCVIADENTERHCFPLLLPALQKYQLITIPSGEENKTLSTCERIWKGMTDQQLDRKAVVINLGGGVIGDMGGFCASTYKRGIDFIQIPTTLLSQVDASVGGKLGVDFFSYKNHIGVFKEPAAVFINADFLKTLDPAELRSGFAEIIKHCLIADKTKWEEISRKSLAEQNWEDLIAHSVEIKSKVTTADPTEQGLRKILNFGHTIGHAIESYYLTIKDKKLLHGEAIAIGMVAESYIAEKRGFISKEELEQIKRYILSVYGKKEIFEFDIEKILPLTLQDKKNEKNQIQCTLLEKVGKANFNNPITFKEIRESIIYYTL